MAKKRVRNLKRTVKASKKTSLLKKDISDNKLMALIATFLSIIGFVVVLISGNKDKYVRFYAKQSLVVFIFLLVSYLVAELASFIPLIGEIIQLVLYALAVAAWVVSWVFALMGEEKEVPIIGKYGSLVKI